MKCENCGKEWGKEAWPALESTMYLTRTTNILGIEAKVLNECIWELDYDNETENESDIIEWEYLCSYCGTHINGDDIEKVVASYSTEENE